MDDIVVDAEFIRKVMQGSANVDRMRREIHEIVSLILPQVNQFAEKFAKFQWNKSCEKTLYPLLGSSEFVEHTLFWEVCRVPENVKQTVFQRKKEQSAKLTIQLCGNRSPYEEDSDLFWRTLYAYAEPVPLQYVMYVHSQLPTLVTWMIEVLGMRSELANTLRLLARAA